LESATDDDDQTMFKNTADFLKIQIEQQIRGRRSQTINIFRRGNNTKYTDKFNWAKVLRSFKTLTVAPIMWLKPITGTANGIFTFLFSTKEAVKGSIVKRFGTSLLGMDQSTVDFTVSDLVWAMKEYFSMQLGFMLGGPKRRDHKMWLLAKQMGYLPDNYDWATDSSELLSRRNKYISQSTMLMFHSLPEEALA